MTDVCIKSDYAVLNTKGYGFYYGYEFDSKECECGESINIWGFEVTKDNNSIYRIKAEEMKKKVDRKIDINNCAEMLALGIPISLGYGVLGWIQPLGMTLLDFFDFVTNSCMMPISALCTVLLIIFVTKLKTISNEIKISSAFKREKVYNFVMKYICIPTLLIILLSYILSTFGIITL